MLVDTLLTFFVIRFRLGLSLILCIFATGSSPSSICRSSAHVAERSPTAAGFPLVDRGLRLRHHDDMAARARESCSSAWRRRGAVEGVPKSLFKDPPHVCPHRHLPHRDAPDAVRTRCWHNLSHNKVPARASGVPHRGVRDVPGSRSPTASPCESLGHGCGASAFATLHEPPGCDARARALRGPRAGIRPDGDPLFFLSRQKIVPTVGCIGMAFWRDRILRRDGAQTPANVTTTSTSRPTG